MAKKKKITVVKQKRPKKPKKSKKARKARKAKKGKKGKGQFGNAFPTNRQIDSNQYWQLRAEIAGAEARVRTSLKDRQEDEKKADKKVAKLETEVKDFTKLSTAQQRQNFPTVGTPDRGRGDAEYDRGDVASRSRSRRSGSSARTPAPRRSRSLSPEGLSRSASAALDPEDHASRALHSRSRSRSPSPGVNPRHGSYGAIGVSGLATRRGQELRRSPEPSGIGARIPERLARETVIAALTNLPPPPSASESVIKRAERD